MKNNDFENKYTNLCEMITQVENEFYSENDLSHTHTLAKNAEMKADELLALINNLKRNESDVNVWTK